VNKSKRIDIFQLLKRIVELVKPDLRHYYRIARKGKVVKSYDSNGKYYVDVQPLKNDESVDENEPLIPQVEIPVIWGGIKCGVVCPPKVGTICILEYFDGNPCCPYVSNFLWRNNVAPDAEIGSFVIQKNPGCYIKIDANNNVINVCQGDWVLQAEGNATINIGGDATINVGGDANINVEGHTTVKSTGIDLNGGSQIFGAVTGGNCCAFTGLMHSDCSQSVKISKV